MADNKNLNNLNKNKPGGGNPSQPFSVGGNKNINELLNNRQGGYGYGGAKPPVTPPTPGAKPTGSVPPKSPFGAPPFTPNKPSTPTSNPFLQPQKPSTPPSQPSNPFLRPQTPPTQTPQPGASNPFLQPRSGLNTGSSLLQNLKQQQVQPQEMQPQQVMQSYKSPKQLREELKRQKQAQKQAGKSAPTLEETRLREELRQLEERQTTPSSGTNAFGSAVKGTIGMGTPNNNSPLFGGGLAGQPAERKPLAANDFFKQLEQLNKINVNTSTNPEELTEEEYLDEKKKDILDQLEKLQKGSKDKDENKKKKGGVFWIVLLSILLAVLIGVGFILYSTMVPRDYEYVRISVEMTDPDKVFYYTGVNGERIPVGINPGDTFNLSIIARNSRNILGDTDAPVWKPIFVRFKIWMQVDGIEMPNFVEITPTSSLWLRYNATVEETYLNDVGLPRVSIDDGYFYYKGMVQPNQQITLINQITFSLHAITEEVAGKNAVLFVQVEVLEDAYAIGSFWVNAPYEWILFLRNNGYIQ